MSGPFLGLCAAQVKAIDMYDTDDSETRSETDGSDSGSDSEVVVPPIGLIELVWQLLKAVPKALPRSSQMESSADRQTVIFLDWDDTLLCTTYLSRCRDEKVSGPLARQLRSLSLRVARLLRRARSLGRTIIITNAEDGWVQHSSALYLPRALPALETVPIISARTRFEPQFPGNTAIWKTQAFLELERHLDVTQPVNLVSLGDSLCEVAAVHALGRQFARSWVKTVRFKVAPSPVELKEQVGVIEGILERVVLSTSSLDIAL